jgi:hypothetical protein
MQLENCVENKLNNLVLLNQLIFIVKKGELV